MESGKDGTIHPLSLDPSAGTDASSAAAAPSSEPTAGASPTAAAPAAEVELSREDILDAKDIQVVRVPVDEWRKGGFVFVQTPSAADRDYMERVVLEGTTAEGAPKTMGKEQVRAHVVAMCVRNADGTRKFKPEDIEALSKKSIVPMERIYNAILASSIITEQDVATLAKNSGAASTGISS